MPASTTCQQTSPEAHALRIASHKCNDPKTPADWDCMDRARAWMQVSECAYRRCYFLEPAERA
eukprot:15002067-Alexandrium_andersonii.AAC.1